MGKVQHMSTNAERLARAVLARRQELDATQLDIWQAGGPSNTTLTKVENGELETLTRTTARRLDMGLQWEGGSARRVWDGGEATPLLQGVDRRDSAWLRQQMLEADLDPDAKARLIEVLDDYETRGRGA